MKNVGIIDYIYFGTALRYLQDAKEGFPLIGSPGREDAFVLGNIKSFLANLESFELHVTKRASWRLTSFLTELTKLPKDHKLTSDEATRLEKIMDEIRPTLMAEAQGKLAFIVTDKRIDVQKLLNGILALFAPNIFQRLPEIAQYDFMESGKCIAFERPTAAAFHCLRATEAVLSHYYCALVKKGRADLMWGPMVHSLKSCRKKPPVALIANLENIKNSFRNPTAHPEARYDISEVQDLFNLCVDVVNRMVKDLDSRKLI